VTIPGGFVDVSGERFTAIYELHGDSEAEVRARAREVCVEETIEFPLDLVAAGDIRDHVVGRVESVRERAPRRWEVAISYAAEVAGAELTQLVNVVYGNVSLMPDVRLTRLELSPTLLAAYRGPRFGRRGLRELVAAVNRPLLATAVKPMGLSCRELAQLAYHFALGGIDVVKDDHGLADQPFAPFRERVERCVEAVARANQETGGRSIYMPNVTAGNLLARARLAKELGAGGLLVAPGLVGLDAVRRLADDDAIALPIISHPAFQGAFVTHPESGLSHYVLFGQLARLAGADATVYPNYGGRFSFSRDACRAIVAGTAVPMGGLRPSFPAPGGGMQLKRIPEMLLTYGRDVIFLIGGDLHRRGPDLVDNARFFRQLAEEM